jgi:hypothetical protein
MNRATAEALAAALALGLPCFPAGASKRPATPHGYRDATSDPAALRQLWRDHPAPPVAIATGRSAPGGYAAADPAMLAGAGGDRMPPLPVHRVAP